MTYRLVYHHAVADDDLPDIPANARERIARAIETRLITSLEKYGTPLKRARKEYSKLRIGDCHVVGNEVRILAIRRGRSIYPSILRATHRLDLDDGDGDPPVRPRLSAGDHGADYGSLRKLWAGIVDAVPGAASSIITRWPRKTFLPRGYSTAGRVEP